MQEQRLERSGSSRTDDECALFIDNSNIFIEGQKYYARHLNLRVTQDPRCRIDIGKLVLLAVDGRTLSYAKLYGSEPPALDTVWKKIREKGVKVKLSKKDFKGKEKEVDTAMTAKAVAYAMKSKAHKQTVIIVAGDRDYIPVVKTICKEKPEWNVELLALKCSIATELEAIKYANFKKIEFETLLKNNPDGCYFVEPRWRTDRYKIPKNRSIILCFKERPEASEDKLNQVLKQYAVAITQITGTPCWYHLCNWKLNAGRQVYIVGFTKVKDKPDIDFFRICREKNHELNTKCSEICELYENYKTAMETEDATTYELKNKFSGLNVEEKEQCTDEDILSHIYDDYDSTVQETESLSQENIESGDEELGAEGFTGVKPKSEIRKHRPKYSAPCRWEFSCLYGRHCDSTHTDEQIEFFKLHSGKGVTGYKSKPCDYYWGKGKCKHDRPSHCAYYHSVTEARCYVCKNSDKPYTGHASHDETCPSKTSKT